MSEADKAQLKVKGQRDKLAQAQKRYSFLIEKTRQNAKVLAQQDKKKEAMILLKKKKSLEVQLKSVDDQVLNIEQMISSIEQAGMQAKFAESMAAGNAALKSITESMGGLEGIERLMDDTAETQAEWAEIGEALQGTLDAQDEEDVAAELAALEEMDAPPVRGQAAAAAAAARPWAHTSYIASDGDSKAIRSGVDPVVPRIREKRILRRWRRAALRASKWSPYHGPRIEAISV